MLIPLDTELARWPNSHNFSNSQITASSVYKRQKPQSIVVEAVLESETYLKQAHSSRASIDRAPGCVIKVASSDRLVQKHVFYHVTGFDQSVECRRNV